jgi:hypothetical protein
MHSMGLARRWSKPPGPLARLRPCGHSPDCALREVTAYQPGAVTGRYRHIRQRSFRPSLSSQPVLIRVGRRHLFQGGPAVGHADGPFFTPHRLPRIQPSPHQRRQHAYRISRSGRDKPSQDESEYPRIVGSAELPPWRVDNSVTLGYPGGLIISIWKLGY